MESLVACAKSRDGNSKQLDTEIAVFGESPMKKVRYHRYKTPLSVNNWRVLRLLLHSTVKI